MRRTETKIGEDWVYPFNYFCVMSKGISIGCYDERCKDVSRKIKNNQLHFHYTNIPNVIRLLNNNKFTNNIEAEVQGCQKCWYGHDCRPTAYTMARFGKIMKSISYHIENMSGTIFTLSKYY